jgi:hypothetical protein
MADGRGCGIMNLLKPIDRNGMRRMKEEDEEEPVAQA